MREKMNPLITKTINNFGNLNQMKFRMTLNLQLVSFLIASKKHRCHDWYFSDYLECIKGEVLILFHSQLKLKKKKRFTHHQYKRENFKFLLLCTRFLGNLKFTSHLTLILKVTWQPGGQSDIVWCYFGLQI